jgi:hypothetical protein
VRTRSTALQQIALNKPFWQVHFRQIRSQNIIGIPSFLGNFSESWLDMMQRAQKLCSAESTDN